MVIEPPSPVFCVLPMPQLYHSDRHDRKEGHDDGGVTPGDQLFRRCGPEPRPVGDWTGHIGGLSLFSLALYGTIHSLCWLWNRWDDV